MVHRALERRRHTRQVVSPQPVGHRSERRGCDDVGVVVRCGERLGDALLHQLALASLGCRDGARRQARRPAACRVATFGRARHTVRREHRSGRSPTGRAPTTRGSCPDGRRPPAHRRWPPGHARPGSWCSAGSARCRAMTAPSGRAVPTSGVRDRDRSESRDRRLLPDRRRLGLGRTGRAPAALRRPARDRRGVRQTRALLVPTQPRRRTDPVRWPPRRQSHRRSPTTARRPRILSPPLAPVRHVRSRGSIDSPPPRRGPWPDGCALDRQCGTTRPAGARRPRGRDRCCRCWSARSSTDCRSRATRPSRCRRVPTHGRASARHSTTLPARTRAVPTATAVRLLAHGSQRSRQAQQRRHRSLPGSSG